MMQREDILQALGRIPQRAKTRARRSLAESKDGISWYLVRYETEPGEPVTAWLLVPEGGRNCPAVVACHQHNDEYFVGIRTGRTLRQGGQHLWDHPVQCRIRGVLPGPDRV